jgi:hypothetical protein
VLVSTPGVIGSVPLVVTVGSGAGGSVLVATPGVIGTVLLTVLTERVTGKGI